MTDPCRPFLHVLMALLLAAPASASPPDPDAASSGGAAPTLAHLTCDGAPGTDPAQVAGLCDALRGLLPDGSAGGWSAGGGSADGPLRLMVLRSSPAGLTARLDRQMGDRLVPGPELGLDVTDRALLPRDRTALARALLRHSHDD